MSTHNKEAAELSPCPFCNSANIKAYEYGQHVGGEPDAFCQCQDCSAIGPGAMTEGEAVFVWNRRSALTASEAPATEQAPAGEVPVNVDWLGLALDLDQQAKHAEKMTATRVMRAAAHGLRSMGAALSAPPAVPQGWKPVPVEPTPQMLAFFSVNAESDYAGMLSAAPAAPQGEQPK